jgi:hypothetical protein
LSFHGLKVLVLYNYYGLPILPPGEGIDLTPPEGLPDGEGEENPPDPGRLNPPGEDGLEKPGDTEGEELYLGREKF